MTREELLIALHIDPQLPEAEADEAILFHRFYLAPADLDEEWPTVEAWTTAVNAITAKREASK